MEAKVAPQSSVQIMIDEPRCSTNPLTGKHFVSVVVLANFHAGYFRISLSLCAQVLLWNNLIQFTKENNNARMHTPLMVVLHMFPLIACTLLWSLALLILILLSVLYMFKCCHHFDKVKEEFLNHVGVNYLFAPWMSCLFLLQSAPHKLVAPRDNTYVQIVWWAFVAPIVMLDVKIYGQWFTKGKRFLSRVANPTCQLSVIANLVAAKGAVYMGWVEVAVCLFSLGMAHYLVLFVTLYQRLPVSNGVSAMLSPVFFLFIATPSMGSLAWCSVTGSFGNACKMLYFVSLFLFMSLICRPTMFKKSMKKFRVACWAYSFPLTLLALTSMEYAQAVEEEFAQILAILLSMVSILVCFVLMVLSTIKFNKLFLSNDLVIN